MLDSKDRRISQIGYVVRDVGKSIEDYSKRLGIGPWDLYTFGAPDSRDAIYRSKPIGHQFVVAILWNRTTQLEFIQPLRGTNIRVRNRQQWKDSGARASIGLIQRRRRRNSKEFSF